MVLWIPPYTLWDILPTECAYNVPPTAAAVDISLSAARQFISMVSMELDLKIAKAPPITIRSFST